MSNIISATDVVMSAKMQLNITHSDNDLWFYKLVDDAVRKLDCLGMLVQKQITLPINDGKMELPSGYWQWLGVMLGSPNLEREVQGQQSIVSVNTEPSSANYPTYWNRPFLTKCGQNINRLSTTISPFIEQGGYLLFDSTIYEEATLSYLGYNTDEDGFLLIYSEYEDCITNYICWKYYDAKLDEMSTNAAFYKVRNYQTLWNSNRRRVQAREQQKSFTYNKFALDLVFRQVHINEFN